MEIQYIRICEDFTAYIKTSLDNFIDILANVPHYRSCIVVARVQIFDDTENNSRIPFDMLRNNTSQLLYHLSYSKLRFFKFCEVD